MSDFERAPGWTRRAVLQSGAMATGLALFTKRLRATTPSSPPSDYLDAAKQAARWISASAQHTSSGMTWPADPSDPKSTQISMYSGSAGVIAFYLELFDATKDERYLATAMAGADHLVSLVHSADARTSFGGAGAGLYTGLAGIAFILERVHAASGRATYQASAHDAFELVKSLATENGRGVSWSTSNDIVSGSAGIGLTLLWGATTFRDTSALALAQAAGRRLMEVALPRPSGLSWEIETGFPRRYPNFSHGAAGVSYFLARLAAVSTPSTDFLNAATAGARYLQSIATETQNGGRIVFHSEPGNESLYYLSWCHGPAGTARLFHQLYALTQANEWRDYEYRLNTALVDSGVPEKRSPGFWNNVSRCCGNCGIADHYLRRHLATHDSADLVMAERLVDDMLARATTDAAGKRWVQAEHRVRPELLVAQTGLMQGAAGMGLTLVQLARARERVAPFIKLPDVPA